jgi:GAF domain-containing protein
MEQRSVLFVAGASGPEPPPTLTDRPVFAVERVETAAAALAHVERTPPACVVTAYDLPDDTGLSLAASVRAAAPDAGVVLYGDVDRETVASDDASAVVEFVDSAGANAATRLAQLVAVAVERRCHAPYPLPAEEDGRLAALPDGDLAERSAAGLDRIAELAALHFGTAYAAVNVVGEHSVSAIGSYGDVADTTPRRASPCTYAILGNGATVIPDLRSDPRFDGVETATFAFYAGAPISDGDDRPIGTVCVYDHDPGGTDGDDERFLSTLAAAAGDWLSMPRERMDGDIVTPEGPQ